MTDTDTLNGSRLVRAVRDRLTVLRNTLGEPVPTEADPQGDLRAVAPNGRLVVAAGQTISSAWGNTTYDQTMQTFATAGDRTNQWPAPNEGALSFLVDSHTPWLFRSGAWHPLPIGYLGSATGPASQTDYSAPTTVVAVSVPVVLGRRYRINGICSAQQVSATGASVLRIRDDVGVDTILFNGTAVAVGTPMVANGAALYVPTSTKTAGISLMANTNAGAVRVAANAAVIFVEDIGG